MGLQQMEGIVRLWRFDNESWTGPRLSYITCLQSYSLLLAYYYEARTQWGMLISYEQKMQVGAAYEY